MEITTELEITMAHSTSVETSAQRMDRFNTYDSPICSKPSQNLLEKKEGNENIVLLSKGLHNGMIKA